MTEKHLVAKKDDFKSERKILVDVEGREILLISVNGKTYAMDNICTHAGGPLNEGEIIGDDQIECPWHAAIFNFKTGQVTEGPAMEGVKTYSVVEENDSIYIEIE